MNALGAVRRKNLLFLKDYYYIRDEKLPLFNYMALRSFNGLLHGGMGWEETPLSWEIRRGIALGAAQAIEYLHSQGPNVLLATSYDPLVSDYGLNRIQAPPKYALKATNPQKDNVYSFGVLLVELLTGKMPGEADFA